MKKLSLSKFDLGFIIAFAVVALLGAGAWWYLSGQLQTAQDDVKQAKTAFDKYSAAAAASTNEKIVVSPANGNTLQDNIKLLTAQIDPVIQDKLLVKENTLRSISKEDPVAWKHDLDDDVHRLNAAAKVHGVSVPSNYYFGFSRYLSQSPGDEQTAVLSKQLVGVEKIATILIEAPVRGIQAIRRTYEEDPHTGSGASSGPASEKDRLAGFAVNATGNFYTAYPFEVDFETTSENLRTVVNNLIQSPYVFVIRSLSVQNAGPNSPVLADLDKLAPPPPADAPPGEPPPAPKGPQFLFGNSTLKVKIRIDMIEWKAATSEATHASGQVAPHKATPPPTAGGNR